MQGWLATAVQFGVVESVSEQRATTVDVVDDTPRQLFIVSLSVLERQAYAPAVRSLRESASHAGHRPAMQVAS